MITCVYISLTYLYIRITYINKFTISKSIMSKSRKRSSKRPEVRSLKIQSKTRFNSYSQRDVPEIKPCGNWLEKSGFIHGQRVLITTMDRLLVIRLEEE